MGYDTILDLINPAVFKDIGNRIDALALDDITGVQALFAERKKSFEEVEDLYGEAEDLDDEIGRKKKKGQVDYKSVAFICLENQKRMTRFEYIALPELIGNVFTHPLLDSVK